MGAILAIFRFTSLDCESHKKNYKGVKSTASTDKANEINTAIKSNLIDKVFQHDKNPEIQKASFDKVTIYEKMLPSVVLVGVQISK